VRAVVVGGGIAGLTAAIALHDRGVDATVYERVEDVAGSQIGAGLGLAYNATRVLRRLGLLDRIAEGGARCHRFEFRSWKGNLLSAWTVPPSEVQLGITRQALHRILVDALPAGSLVAGKTCVRFEQEPSSVSAIFEDGTSAEGDVLVGADGLRSTIRAQIRGSEPPRYAGFSVLRTVVPVGDDAALPADVFRLLWGKGGCLGMYHVGPGLVYIFGWVKGPEGEHVPRGQRKQTLQQRYRDWSPEAAALVELSTEEAIHQTDIYDRKPLDDWGEGRVTFAGDAAHPMTFNMGQGACQGIEDAVVLARHLSTASDVPAALRAYESERRKRADKFTEMSSRVSKMSLMDGWRSSLRNLLLKGVGKRISRGEKMLMVDLY